MARIPEGLRLPELPPLKKLGEGKVRGTWEVESDILLQLASNRISIYNFILNGLVPFKGEILTAMTIFWLTQVLKNFRSHLGAYGKAMNPYLPDELKNHPVIMRQGLLVKRLDLPDIEGIVRMFLTGSGWKRYQQTGSCYGYDLPPGLWDGAELPYPIFTPTEKSDDVPWIHHDEVAKRHGSIIERVALQTFQLAFRYAKSRGILIADTKEEMAEDGTLADEIFTPDSSRFWDEQDWLKKSMDRKSPTSLDKERVRRWGQQYGIDKRDPKSDEEIKFVEKLGLPEDVALMTSKIYRYIFSRLVGKKLEAFQNEYMLIPDAKPPALKIAVLIGSQSDKDKCIFGLEYLRSKIASEGHQISLNVVSCHRNPEELRNFAQKETPDVVIAAAGLAAALPGITKAWFRAFKKDVPVIGVGFPGINQDQDLAAKLSIEQLPGQPVILDEKGRAYMGMEGFNAACRRAIESEFMPDDLGQSQKPAEFGIFI